MSTWGWKLDAKPYWYALVDDIDVAVEVPDDGPDEEPPLIDNDPVPEEE